MKSKAKKEIKTKTLQELVVLLNEAKRILFQLQLEKAQLKLKDTRSIFMKRKEIARLYSVMKEKELRDEKNN